MLLAELSGLKLPSGRQVSIYDLVKFCYDLSETDIELLFKLLAKKQATIEELSTEMGVSNATVSRSLTRLIGLGFVRRMRTKSESGIGRPKYVYTTDKKLIENKLKSDIELCLRVVKNVVVKTLEGSISNLLEEE
jgi:predicted transcriptional regulator